MLVSSVTLKNFRNYQQLSLGLNAGCNILVGENAQGKSNFLEAIELSATGRSSRADRDIDLIRWQTDAMSAEVAYLAGGHEENLALRMVRTPSAGRSSQSFRVDKQATINGVTQKSLTDLAGRLLVVSFASYDLNLLRGGPKYRRDWLDSLILKLRPSFAEIFAGYAKSVAQRNKLLKCIFERGKVTVTDQDQLLVWDKQVCRFGARLIKQRLALLAQLLPLAEMHQRRISRNYETLGIRYLFKAQEKSADEAGSQDDLDSDSTSSDSQTQAPLSTAPLAAAQLAEMEEGELSTTLMRLLKERRSDEIRRKQTTVGPHRDDLIFCLNDADAVAFASQGQQRSIVVSLKMAEVALLSEFANDLPVLLLDDVLAELDEFRQGLLMELVEKGSQTIITTTHTTSFDPRWLKGASIFKVSAGNIVPPSLV